MGDNDKKKPGVDFSLEEDAEEIFLKFLEENEPVAIESEQPRPARRAMRGGSLKIDLHGLSLDEAKAELLRRVDGLIATGKGDWQLRVVTGKGRHSGPGGGVLVKGIYDFFLKNYRQYVVRIDSDPGESVLEGLPIRGHFDALLKL